MAFGEADRHPLTALAVRGYALSFPPPASRAALPKKNLGGLLSAEKNCRILKVLVDNFALSAITASVILAECSEELVKESSDLSEET